MPNNDDQLQQQYQEILNKYASSLTPPVENKEVVPLVVNPVITKVNLEPEIVPVASEPNPIFEVSKPESLISTDSPKIIPPKVIEKAIVSEPIVKEEPVVPPIYFPSEPIQDKPSNFFKYLFYFSLTLFMVVVSAIIYNLFSNQSEPAPTSVNPATAGPTPTKIISQFCELNDKKYIVGESFPSTDSCNTCSCTPNLTIACTEKACVTPEPTVKTVGKTYKDIKYGYQFECPTTAKYVVEATSVNGNKIPFKQESCTSGESVTTISVYDNTVVHSFGDIKTTISPDKKYIVTLEGDDDFVISSFKFL